jgi:hypothetical protein
VSQQIPGQTKASMREAKQIEARLLEEVGAGQHIGEDLNRRIGQTGDPPCDLGDTAVRLMDSMTYPSRQRPSNEDGQPPRHGRSGRPGPGRCRPRSRPPAAWRTTRPERPGDGDDRGLDPVLPEEGEPVLDASGEDDLVEAGAQLLDTATLIPLGHLVKGGLDRLLIMQALDRIHADALPNGSASTWHTVGPRVSVPSRSNAASRIIVGQQQVGWQQDRHGRRR